MLKIYVASVTAFDQNNNINERVTSDIMEMNLKQGATGFFVGGSSAENFLMSYEERVRGLELSSKFLDRADLYAHIGAIGTDEAIGLAKVAKELGYKKFSATPPFYFGFNQKAIASYFYDISNAIDFPILYYNIPINTHKEIDLLNKDTTDLLKSGVISGLKHTNLDLYQMERIKNINDNLECYGGFEQMMLPFLTFGCSGFIGSTFNFMLPHYSKIYDLYNENKMEEALALQKKANNIMEVIWNIGLFPSIKYILTNQGFDVGLCRRPFVQLTAEEKIIIDRVILENLCN